MREKKIIRLRPLNVGELLDESIELYKSNFVLFISISALLYMPQAIISVIINPNPITAITDPFSALPGAVFDLVWILLIAGPIVGGALTYAISERYLGNSINIKSCFKRISSRQRLVSLLLTDLISNIIIGVSWGVPIIVSSFILASLADNPIIFIVLCLFIGLINVFYVIGKLSLAIPANIVESLPASNSIKRSWGLSRKYWFRIAGLNILMIGIIGLLQALITAPTGSIFAFEVVKGNSPSSLIMFLNKILQSASSALFMPVAFTLNVLLYYDSRIKDEGFDLEILAAEIAKERRYINEIKE